MMKIQTADVVVVGAGSAGAHAAALLVRAGLQVVVVERRPRGLAGAQWTQGVPARMFGLAGADFPTADEVHSMGMPAVILSTLDGDALHFPGSQILDLDMRRFGQRLIQGVESARGGQVYWSMEVIQTQVDADGRLRRIIARPCNPGHNGHNGDGTLRLEAPLFVDASGVEAALRSRVAGMSRRCPVSAPEDMCLAAQEVRQIADRAGAEAFLERHSARCAQSLFWLGCHGGYSAFRLSISPDFETVSLLAGTRAIPQMPCGKEVLYGFVSHNTWIGKRLFGGARPIPLRRPHTSMVSPGLAILGDTASQVYSVHGSGTGIGLHAAHLLAKTIIHANRQGSDVGSPENLWAYPYHFHRKWGGLLGASDRIRRQLQNLSALQIRRLLNFLSLSMGIFSDMLAQSSPKLNVADLLKLLKNMPEVAAYLPMAGKLIPRVAAIHLLASRYPSWERRDRLSSYEAAMQGLVGG